MCSGSLRVNSTHPVGSQASHFESLLPSTRFSATSPPPVFSSLAAIPVIASRMSPGTSVASAPFTPSAFRAPDGRVSTVSTQVGAGSPGSKEE